MEASNKLAVLLLWLVMAAATAVHPSYSENSPQDYLTPQNSARAAVGVGPVTWSTKLQQFAEKYAAQRAGDCRLQHSGGPYGENIFWGSAGFDWKAVDAVRSWVDEKQWYNYATNSCAAGKVCGTTRRWCGAPLQASAARASCAATTVASLSSATTSPAATLPG